MSAPLDISEPPYLWLRLLPDGPLYLALSGSVPQGDLGARLQRPDFEPVSRPGRVTVALFDLTGFAPLEQGHVGHLVQLARGLAAAGCGRLAVAAAPAQAGLVARMFGGLPQQTSSDVQVGCFDQQQQASQWLFSSQPAPPPTTVPPGTSQAMTEATATAHAPPPSGPGPGSPGPTVRPSHPQIPSQALPPTAFAPPPQGPPGPAITPLAPTPPAPPAPTPSSTAASALAPLVFKAPSLIPGAPTATTKPSAQPLDTSAPRDAPVLPMLLGSSPELARVFLARYLLPSFGAKLDHNPLVAVAVGAPPRRFALLREPGAQGDLLDEMMAEAIVDLDRMELPLEERRLGGKPFARSTAPMAAEGILSPRTLGRLQELLRTRVMAVAIPARGSLLAAPISPDGGAALGELSAMARSLFEGGGAQALSPHLFMVDNGKLVGPLRLEFDAPPPRAPSPSQPQVAPGMKVLPARTVAEAHLYMDLRGAEPGARGQRLVQAGNELVSVYEARCHDDPAPTRFAFLVEDVTAPPWQYGGAAPSKIIAPDEFMVWADLLSKKVPASAEGLDPEQRRRHKLMLESAASCLLEAAKFIPPGAERVPEGAMALRDRWEKLQITPGRFDRPRLEIVAKTYRDIAARF